MGFNNSNDNFFSPRMPANCFAQHAERLTHARSVTKKKLEDTPLLLRNGFLQPLFRGLGHCCLLCANKPVLSNVGYNRAREISRTVDRWLHSCRVLCMRG